MRFPNNSPDYKIWYDSYKEEYDSIVNETTYDVISEEEYLRKYKPKGFKAIKPYLRVTPQPNR